MYDHKRVQEVMKKTWTAGRVEHIRISDFHLGPSAVCLHNQVEQLNQLSQQDIKMEPEPETSNGIQELAHPAYIDGKNIIFPEETEQQIEKAVENSTKWPNNGVEAPEPQHAIQNIDQELLFKVANILSASNDAAQLITDWSHSPNKLQTNSLEEQLRHFAEHHQKVLAISEPASSLNIPQGGLEKSQQ